jgi:hypothetical protein
MIKINQLSENDFDRKVIYRPKAGNVEEGFIVSWNNQYVFVRYGKTPCGIATSPEDLEFIEGICQTK